MIFEVSTGDERGGREAGWPKGRGDLQTLASIAIAFNEDNDALREAANKIIAEMKTDGTLDEQYQKWFQSKPPEAVLKKTNTPE